MNDCIFCKIVAGEIPNYTIYEDEHSLAFLDISPQAMGHTVVIPKKHFTNLGEIDDTNFADLMLATKKAAEKIQEVLNPDGFNIGWNDRPAGGQAVAHIHMHIMPRWDGDGGGNMHSIINNKGELSVEEVHQKFA